MCLLFSTCRPNGAGKSTAISVLTGLIKPSGGTAYISGKNIRTDMPAVYRIMGVCPQHDLLW
jgi:ABC-type multidrug transport system ATPase subunit